MVSQLEKTTQKVKLEIYKLDPEVITPEYASSGSAGFDLRAFLESQTPITIPARGRAIVPTGLKMVIPEAFELQIRPRSGLAFKNGISLTNTPGTIDSDYRGEIKILMVNHSDEDFVVNHNDRIAQAVIAPVRQADFVELDAMPDEANNTRGAGGFGSTGVK